VWGCDRIWCSWGITRHGHHAHRHGSDSRDVSIEEEIVESDLLGPQLYQQRSLSLAEPLMELQPLLGGRRRVSVCRAAFLVFSPCAYPCPLCLRLTPSSERCSEWVQLERCVCWLLSAAVFSPSSGLFWRLGQRPRFLGCPHGLVSI
jgi:hypothetical protein